MSSEIASAPPGSDATAMTLAGLTLRAFSHHGQTRDVYRAGEGPAVLLLSEFPGITPPTLELVARLLRAGYAVVLPQLFGQPGEPLSASAVASSVASVCISREFSLFARRSESPVTEWLRALARHEHRARGGPGVGVIGMCVTGNFALAMMLEPSVLAPVLCQPTLPLALTPGARRELGLAPAALEQLKQRCRDEQLCVLGLRFSHDVLSPGERFARLREELGSHFVGIELPSGRNNRHGIPRLAHSVLTNDYVDEPGHPTHDAFQQVLGLFARTLQVKP